MEDELEIAVNTALGADQSMKQQAIEFCNMIKDSPDGWRSGLALFIDSKPRSDAARFFSLQIVDAALPKLSRADLDSCRQSLFSYIQSVASSTSVSFGEPFLRNKLSQTTSYLFLLTYESIWPSFFQDLLNIQSSDFSNTKAVDLYLRVLNSIHAEIGDNLIARSSDLTKRNNVLKDLIRERDVAKLTQSWRTILEIYSSRRSTDKIVDEIIDSCLKVVGGWVSWIDITLIINSEYLTLIFNFLQDKTHKLTTCDTLLEIVSKKMKPDDKFELIQLLSLKDILSRLSSDDIDFEERIAKLSNVVTLELVHIMDGSTASAARVPVSSDVISKAEAYLVDFMPTIIHFLSNEYDDTSAQVYPSISEYLAFVRTEARQAKAKVDTSNMQKHKDTGTVLDFPPDSAFISPTRRDILQLILTKIIMKMRYDSDSDWTGGDDESESEFLDIRGKLRILQDQVASIDMDLYIDGIFTVVSRSFDPSAVSSWQDVELGLFELSAFSESLKNGAINVVKGIETKASRTLHELFFKMISSNVVSMNHPSIQLHYMELVTRHCMFFSSTTQNALTKVLECFVSQLGIHNSNRRVQIRSWYLLYRFVKSVRGILDASIAETLFTSVQPLLQIKAELPSKDDDSEISGTQAAGAGAFDSQLYLFELCGLLLSNNKPNPASNNVNKNGAKSNSSQTNLNAMNFNESNENTQINKNTLIEPQKQLALMRTLLQPIYTDVEQQLSKNNTSDPLIPIQVHHDLRALGIFSRGFAEVGTGAASISDGLLSSSSNNNNMDSEVAKEFVVATQVVITSLERMGNAEVIRDAARFAISRLIPVLGSSILPEVTRLISCLLEQSKPSELSDFLGFLGQLVHNFRKETGVYEMFDTLMTPLFTAVSSALKQVEAEAASGSTDAVMRNREIRKAYLSFLFNLLNNGMGAVLFSKKNEAIYEPVLQSLLTYGADAVQDPASAKVAVLSLNKMLQIWGPGIVSPGGGDSGFEPNYNASSPVPGFTEFTMQHVSRLTWEVPTGNEFNSRNAQMRSVLGDLGIVQHTIYTVHGPAYLQFLSQQYLPGIGLPQQYVEEYLSKLQSSDTKAFKTFYIQFIAALTNKN